LDASSREWGDTHHLQPLKVEKYRSAETVTLGKLLERLLLATPRGVPDNPLLVNKEEKMSSISWEFCNIGGRRQKQRDKFIQSLFIS
jgi:hypothetical protein